MKGSVVRNFNASCVKQNLVASKCIRVMFHLSYFMTQERPRKATRHKAKTKGHRTIKEICRASMSGVASISVGITEWHQQGHQFWYCWSGNHYKAHWYFTPFSKIRFISMGRQKWMNRAVKLYFSLRIIENLKPVVLAMKEKAFIWNDMTMTGLKLVSIRWMREFYVTFAMVRPNGKREEREMDLFDKKRKH